MDEHVFVAAVGQVWQCLPRSIASVHLFHGFYQRCLLFLEELDIFLAVGSIVRSSLLGVDANSVVDAAPFALACTVALQPGLDHDGAIACLHVCTHTLIFRILQRSHALETLLARGLSEESGDSASGCILWFVTVWQSKVLLVGRGAGDEMGPEPATRRFL